MNVGVQKLLISLVTDLICFLPHINDNAILGDVLPPIPHISISICPNLSTQYLRLTTCVYGVNYSSERKTTIPGVFEV